MAGVDLNYIKLHNSPLQFYNPLIASPVYLVYNLIIRGFLKSGAGGV
jgi:hypothetical protein